MYLLMPKAALSPILSALPDYFGDVAEIIFCIALAYFAYGLFHQICDLMGTSDHWLVRRIRGACKVAIAILLYLIAGLYALEYLAVKAAG